MEIIDKAVVALLIGRFLLSEFVHDSMALAKEQYLAYSPTQVCAKRRITGGLVRVRPFW
jgi:hypothetical protein